MPALNTDLSVEQGSTFVLEFQVFNDELQPLSLLTSEINAFGTLVYSIDDYNVRMKIRKSKYRDPILFTIGTTMTYAFQPGRTQGFVQDGVFWEFLAYCAGTGGSILIIGSAAGVAVMGLEKIDFGWYLKKISLWALLGYLSGGLVYIIMHA